MNDDVIQKILKNPKLATKMFPTPERAFDQCLRELGITYHYKADALVMDKKIVPDSLVLSKLKVHLRGHDPHGIGALAKDLLVIWKHTQESTFQSALVKKTDYRTGKSDLVSEWVLAVTGAKSELDVTVMTHFVWQIKRKMRLLAVEHHMMPILFGRSGGGKSVAVSQLLSPMTGVTVATNMEVFEDPFAKRMLSRNYVAFIDELQGSEDVSINHMKQIITATTIEWRVMRSEQMNSAPQNATFIGCSNDPVRDRICDPTSSRRFWELKCQDQLDWNLINSIDYVELWRSVNEHDECPIKKVIDGVRTAQKALIKTE